MLMYKIKGKIIKKKKMVNILVKLFWNQTIFKALQTRTYRYLFKLNCMHINIMSIRVYRPLNPHPECCTSAIGRYVAMFVF